RHILAHLWTNRLIEDLQGVNTSNLDIKYSDLLKKIRAGDPAWEAMVPAAVRDIIKSRNYFGYGGGNEE
ncbi:MAG: TonB-dependent receptor, partial [Verrucomicrobiia bacterium]